MWTISAVPVGEYSGRNYSYWNFETREELEHALLFLDHTRYDRVTVEAPNEEFWHLKSKPAPTIARVPTGPPDWVKERIQQRRLAEMVQPGDYRGD